MSSSTIRLGHAPKVATAYKQIADAITNGSRQRGKPPTHLNIHPIMYAWIVSSLPVIDPENPSFAGLPINRTTHIPSTLVEVIWE